MATGMGCRSRSRSTVELLPGQVICEFKYRAAMPRMFKEIVATLGTAADAVFEVPAIPRRAPGSPTVRDVRNAETAPMPKSQVDPLADLPQGSIPCLSVDDMLMRLGLGAAFGVAVGSGLLPDAEEEAGGSGLVRLDPRAARDPAGDGQHGDRSDIARAFSLVGALAIVRFRTVVEDTRDTAFVIFAVIAGMAAGAGAYRVAAYRHTGRGRDGVATAGLGRKREWEATRSPSGKLVVRLGIGSDPNGTLGETLRKHTTESRLVAIGTARQGAAIDLTYLIRFVEGCNSAGLASDLNRVEGVQGVEWGEGKKEE